MRKFSPSFQLLLEGHSGSSEDDGLSVGLETIMLL